MSKFVIIISIILLNCMLADLASARLGELLCKMYNKITGNDGIETIVMPKEELLPTLMVDKLEFTSLHDCFNYIDRKLPELQMGAAGLRGLEDVRQTKIRMGLEPRDIIVEEVE